MAEIARRIAAATANPRRRCTRLLATLALFGCAPQGSLGKDGASSSDGSTTHAGSESSETTTHATVHGSESASSTDESGSSSSHGSESTSTGVAVCEHDGTEDACLACLELHCCAPWQGCHDDAACSCASQCVADGGTVASCTGEHCPESAELFTPVHECAHMNCPTDCPWAV